MTRWVTRLVAANVLVYFLTTASPGLVDRLAFVPALAFTEPWRLFTYMFVHGGLGHVAFNMLALYFFGPQLEVRLGARHFLGLYVVSGLVGAVASMPLGYPIIGASGATFGVSLGFARYWPRVKLLFFGIIPIEAWQLVPLFTVISLLGTAGLVMPGVAHMGHLGGFLGGYLYLMIWESTSSAARFRARAAPAPTTMAPSEVERWGRINRDALHPVNREELDRVLEKIAQGGPGSLSVDERAFLNRLS